MAGGGSVAAGEAAAGGGGGGDGSGSGGGVTFTVVMRCLTAAAGGLLLWYDIGITGHDVCNRVASSEHERFAPEKFSPDEISYQSNAYNALRKKVHGGWDQTYTRSFFPYWRSVLGARCNLRVYPSDAAADDKSVLEQLRNRMSNGPSSIHNHNIGLIGIIQQMASTYQSRTYNTAAYKKLAKVLKNA